MNAAKETVTAISQGLAAGRQTAGSAPIEIAALIFYYAFFCAFFHWIPCTSYGSVIFQNGIGGDGVQ
jgi:hypothetical protein